MSIDTLNLVLIASMALGVIMVALLIWDAQRAHEANIAFQKRTEAKDPPDWTNDQYKVDRSRTGDNGPYGLVNLGKASLLTRGEPAEPRPPKKPRARRRK